MMDRKVIEIPSKCPCCSSDLVTVNEQLFCVNTECQVKLEKTIEHFATVMKIKGLGPKSVEKLNLFCVADLYALTTEDLESILGPTIGCKIYTQIQETLNADLATVLQALSIPKIGKVLANKLATVATNIKSIDASVCASAGLGKAATDSVVEWLRNNAELVDALPFKFSNTAKPISSKTVCISGSIEGYSNRDALKKCLQDIGYSASDSVTTKTMALICEENKNSAKVKQAIKYNIPILTLKEFLEKEINNEQI